MAVAVARQDDETAEMGFRPATRLEAFVYELCADYGYCLPPDREAELLAEPPRDVDAFVDAVLRAEGLDPILCARERLELSEVVRDWLFDEGRGKGTKSGLPLGISG